MTITSYGFDGTVDQVAFSKLMGLLMGTTQKQIVEGLAPSVATGTRLVGWNAGAFGVPGVAAFVDAAGTTAFDVNSSGMTRLDYLVGEVHWATKSSAIKFVKGIPAVKAVLPSLTQIEGVTWQVPIAEVKVRTGVGQLLESDLTPCRPLRPSPKSYSDAATHETAGPHSDGTVIATRNIPDPGWPYRLQVSGGAGFSNVASGNGRIYVTVNGELLTDGRAGRFNEADAVLRSKSTAVLSGESAVVMRMAPSNMDDDLHCTDGDLNVLLLPA